MSTSAYKKILIIEDEEVFIKPLSKYLTLNKFQVNIAKNADTAINLQNNINFDIIITDLRLEDSSNEGTQRDRNNSGLAVIDKIIKKYPDAKIIVVSGFLEDDLFKTIKKNSHVSAVFEKPINFDELLEKIKEII